MNDELQLSEDQQRRIAATLKRIRAGLDKHPDDASEEPSHVYIPEVPNDNKD
ncbi:MAG: hypothetical protein AB8B79_17495 [Granulosicoccus sp.]